MSSVESLQKEWDTYKAGSESDTHRAAIVKGWCKEAMSVVAETSMTKENRHATAPNVVALATNLTTKVHEDSPEALKAQLYGLRRLIGTMQLTPAAAEDLAARLETGNLSDNIDAQGIAVWLHAVAKPRVDLSKRAPRQVY